MEKLVDYFESGNPKDLYLQKISYNDNYSEHEKLKEDIIHEIEIFHQILSDIYKPHIL